MSKENNESIIDMPKPTRPINYKKIIDDFFNTNRNYIEALEHQIIIDNKPFPYICLKLKDIMISNEDFYRHIKNDPENTIKKTCEVLLDKVKLIQDVNDFLRKEEKCKFEEIHLSFDLEEIKDDIPVYQNFSLGTKPYVGKLIRIIARFNDLELYRENVATIITYTCFVCGAEFEMIQFKPRKGKYKKPNFCIKRSCKAKGIGDFIVKKVKEYREMGGFRISEIDFSKQNEMDSNSFLKFD